MIEYILMGASAAGAIGGYQISKQSAKVEQLQLQSRLRQETLASNQQSLMNLGKLKETLATQRAMQAARGVMPGMGSSLAIAQKSVSAFNRDEAARKLSLGFLKSQRESQMAMSRMGVSAAKSQLISGILSMGAQVAHMYKADKGSLTGGDK